MIYETPVIFHSQSVPLSGCFLRSSQSLRDRQPAAIVIGSWLTVKEQMATTYGRKLAEAGYTAFTFDFAGFGESRGEPRQAEIPSRKIGDIHAAADFLRSMAFIDADRIGCVAICASAQYALAALADGAPIRSFASVAGWYHDRLSVASFYGGEGGVERRLARAYEALKKYARSGDLVLAPAYADGDERAGMHFRLDYYARPDRGAVPAWKNEMAEMTWFCWFAFDGLSAADRVSTPSLFVHSDGCVFPERVRQVHARVKGPKELVWARGEQIDFYDQPEQVDVAVGLSHAGSLTRLAPSKRADEWCRPICPSRRFSSDDRCARVHRRDRLARAAGSDCGSLRTDRASRGHVPGEPPCGASGARHRRTSSYGDRLACAVAAVLISALWWIAQTTAAAR